MINQKVYLFAIILAMEKFDSQLVDKDQRIYNYVCNWIFDIIHSKFFLVKIINLYLKFNFFLGNDFVLDWHYGLNSFCRLVHSRKYLQHVQVNYFNIISNILKMII